ncbi:hypothetical protein ACEWY4_003186 [Coilia grayii]|uniref:Immunoglobulin V-set domain-containing protein n=1 Tax=Coilia grayii TaxID=363190 RepID=A0ABD1KQH2_9TELE
MTPTSLFILLTVVACESDGYSSYATAWIRQPAGKTLEWIAHIWGGGDIYRADSLKSRFSISKDPSSSTVTLRGQNLQTGDSAVYYLGDSPSAVSSAALHLPSSKGEELMQKPQLHKT